MAKRINIPNVTGNIVITAVTSAISSSGLDPVSGNVLSYMTYGKGINQTTAVITDNPECWATVDSVTVVNGKTYTITLDAAHVWVYSFDDSDNFVSQLVIGDNKNPQTFTFTADSSHIRFGCYDPNHALTYCTLAENEGVKIALYRISNMTAYKGQTFNILYSSNISAVKHEISWDGGNTFWDKTSEILVENTVNYKYRHNAETSYDSFNMAIRVTDANGNTDVKYFTITFKDNETEAGDNFVFTRYKRLDDGVLVDYTDESEASYYSTVNMNEVIAGASYTISINSCNYICVCYYDGNQNYVSYTEAHTDDWSVKGLSTTITIPSNVKYIRVCVTNSGTQVVGTLTQNTSTGGTENPPIESGNLLDSNGAYTLDDFTGTSLDRSKWDYEWGYVRNGELQNYQDTNAVVNNGILELQGRKDGNGKWTAASIISKGHFAFMYGKIECRAKIDPTWGSFSAFWTLGDSFEFGYHNWSSPDTLGEWWAYCGEFDVMEFYSGRLTCGTFFNEREESGRVWYDNYDFNAWHTFAMEWLENGTLIFSIDGHELSRTNPTDNRAFHIPHFILINQAIGASGGTPADGTTAITQYVDWVKYYPASTENVVLNSSNFSLQVTDRNDSAHNCVVRPTFHDNCINKSLTWSSSDSSLVWVHSGLCGTYAGANGTVNITATSHSGVSESITLTVTNGTLRSSSGSGGDTGGDSGGSSGGNPDGDFGGSTGAYTSAVIGDFTTVGDCSGISIDSSNNLVASTLDKFGMVKLNKPVRKLQFNVRDNQADHGALCWYIYNTYKDGANNKYNMIALSNVADGENGKLFKMAIPGTYAGEIDKLDIPAINPGEQLTIEITDSAPTTKRYKDDRLNNTVITTEVVTTQTIKRADGTILTTLTGNMSGWCGQSTNSSPFCSNIQYVPEVVYDNPSYSVKDYKITLSQDGYSEVFDANNFISLHYCQNSKDFVWEDGETYALALSLDSTGSKFRIDGMYPSACGYRLENNQSGEPYVLLDNAYVPTVNNFNFSAGVRNGDLENQHQLDTNLLNDCLYTFNCALPALNYHLDNNSTNTVVLDRYQETWYGLSMTLDDRFVTRINQETLLNEYGDLNSSTESYKAWKGVVVHELGHSLGLDDNATHYPTLYTYGRDRTKVNYLQAPDIFTLKSLYKEKYNIDISKSQEDINSQVATLGLGTHTSPDKPSGRILSVHFDYPAYTNNELYDKSDLIIEGKLEFDRCESINIGSENNPLILKYNVYKIIPNSVIKGEITNYELKIHVSENIDIGANNTYKLYLKQFENVPCSLVNIEQGIQIKE